MLRSRVVKTRRMTSVFAIGLPNHTSNLRVELVRHQFVFVFFADNAGIMTLLWGTVMSPSWEIESRLVMEFKAGHH